ncbi:hypothetical protein MPTK1_2g12190 [Marchantia polymorpha subsp. ruderalis]|uniref:Uncharacterized protein n=1 Tax=Marchantia polymorpha TaxID=3197 RepID=A0A2R6XCR1_MARPO|nr:hypothetical protein MARPO_0023s0183 [Marchantia polymorpha]BBN02029.1 hypothetical protein Mp_2g12190 [Marchantia polymorpha subsp. ruderalis]|eukprot:PTQ43892.1 hypothetical protein MARPO_0023s0183 [Marchantia polymorpha]
MSATFRCGLQDIFLLFELSSTRIALLCITTEPPERSDTVGNSVDSWLFSLIVRIFGALPYPLIIPEIRAEMRLRRYA